MPQIQTYDDHVTAQGGIAAQANPNDFGAQVGQAVQGLGGSIAQAGEAVQQYNTTQDVTNVHVNMAKARAEWTKNLQDRANAAQPGDETFAPTLMKDMQDYFAKFGESVQTPRGKQLFTQMSASMSSEFGQRAIGIQGELAAKDAVNKYDLLSKSVGSTAYQDQTQLDAAIADGQRAIDDPNGMFARIPQTARDKFKQQLENDAKFAAANGFVEKNPKALLGSIQPDMLKMFDPAGKLIQSNTAPGATATISDAAKQWAPQVQAAASVRGLNPNILLAQIDQESGGNPNAVGPMTKYGTAKGLTQFIDSTAQQYGVDVTNPKSAIAGQAAMMSDMLKRYGGDYSKALAAYNWGPGNVDKTLQMYGNDWQNHLPAETSKYVASIMVKSGSVASLPTLDDATPDTTQTMVANAANAAGNTPVTSTLPFMNGLSWEQQNHIVDKAVQLTHMQMTMAHRAQEEADYQLKKQQDAASSQYITRIIDPTNNGGTPTDEEIASNPVLTWQEKQHMVDYKLTRQRELTAAAENKKNPVEVRRLENMIYAPDSDPTKTYSEDPVLESWRLGKISSPEMKQLLKEVTDLKTGTGDGFLQEKKAALDKAYGTFIKSFEAALPGGSAAANDAYYRFRQDLNNRAEAMRSAGKNPMDLLTVGNRDYMLSPQTLQTYWPSASTIMAQQAGKVAAASAPAANREADPGLEIGKTYTVNGAQITYLGGPKNLRSSWQ